ncbi:uncharacterized protein BDR25DRAFT_354459 [Lindgomyces ingoldianus]|uniref:Uncharacterized protein n=1 Tax=Lindgomyces ingoldianus TaxID=673940 RepID=A0ACB6QYC3_9PLEO|nr:uncharacterized protein BDR25DRAFT_354459 [Lindgomyces ingoldianus]KAF2471201.1 hypothetical protein BDR25DRAFT_354459 [Lindgomyces ingoldianus]
MSLGLTYLDSAVTPRSRNHDTTARISTPSLYFASFGSHYTSNQEKFTKFLIVPHIAIFDSILIPTISLTWFNFKMHFGERAAEESRLRTWKPTCDHPPKGLRATLDIVWACFPYSPFLHPRSPLSLKATTNNLTVLINDHLRLRLQRQIYLAWRKVRFHSNLVNNARDHSREVYGRSSMSKPWVTRQRLFNESASGNATSLLEIAALASPACTILMYLLQLVKPKDIVMPIYTPAARYPTAEEMHVLASRGCFLYGPRRRDSGLTITILLLISMALNSVFLPFSLHSKEIKSDGLMIRMISLMPGFCRRFGVWRFRELDICGDLEREFSTGAVRDKRVIEKGRLGMLDGWKGYLDLINRSQHQATSLTLEISTSRRPYDLPQRK